MAITSTGAWKTILVGLGILFGIGLLLSGFLLPAVVIIVLALVLWGGSMLYRKAGPPEE